MKTATQLSVSFKAKPREIFYAGDDSPDHLLIQIPQVKRSHCNMPEFRCSQAFGSYANSDLFLGMLTRTLKRLIPAGCFKLDLDPPPIVTIEQEGETVAEIETSGFLASVKIFIPDSK